VLLSFLLLTIVNISGCGITEDEPQGQWCYLESGWYLILNDWNAAVAKRVELQSEWPSVGYVTDVWATYQTDDSMELTQLAEGNFTLAELHGYQEQGYPVCIKYWNETMYHVRPLWFHEQPDVHIKWAFVAYGR
jgi:hypothetical protein